jgi:hypothetical protein
MVVSVPSAQTPILPVPLTTVQFQDLAAIPRDRMVRQSHQPAHPPRLPARYHSLSGLRRPTATGTVPRRHPRPRHRLAAAARAARPRQRYHQAQAGGAVLALRLPVSR